MHPAFRPSGRPAAALQGRARQLLLHCSTTDIHVGVRASEIAPGDFVEPALRAWF